MFHWTNRMGSCLSYDRSLWLLPPTSCFALSRGFSHPSTSAIQEFLFFPPLPSTNMPDPPKTEKKRKLYACEATKHVKKPNISALAGEHCVSRSLLLVRLRGGGTLTDRKLLYRKSNHLLSERTAAKSLSRFVPGLWRQLLLSTTTLRVRKVI